MKHCLHSRQRRRDAAPMVACFAALLAVGCASPGPPKPPSLDLPQPVTDLTASRMGNGVELSFTVPHLSTDKLPLFDAHHRKTTTLHGTICREAGASLKAANCTAVATIAPEVTEVDRATFRWHETLPEALTKGQAGLLVYRVEFLNKAGRSAGRSNAAYSAAGTPPPPVAGLRAEGRRGGVLLQWTRDTSTTDILVHRVELDLKDAAKSGRSADVWLNANSVEGRTLDASVKADTAYRYTAVRATVFTLDRHTVEVRSDVSAGVEFTLHPVYAPAEPTGVDATGFMPPDGSHFAVDLIWQPISDAGTTKALAAPLAGYNVYREALNGDGMGAAKVRLTATPAMQPSFHDATAEPTVRYRYSVTAIDGNGNESRAATFTLEPFLLKLSPEGL